MRLDHLLSKEEEVRVLDTVEYFIKVLKDSWCRCAQGKHPFPSRTRRLRLVRPMVLCWRRHGRAGGCQDYYKNSLERVFYIERTYLNGRRKRRSLWDSWKKEWEGCVNLLQQGSAVPYNWFLPVIRELKRLSFLMTDKTSVAHVLWKLHIESISRIHEFLR